MPGSAELDWVAPGWAMENSAVPGRVTVNSALETGNQVQANSAMASLD